MAVIFGVRWQSEAATALWIAMTKLSETDPKRRRRPAKPGLCRRTPNPSPAPRARTSINDMFRAFAALTPGFMPSSARRTGPKDLGHNHDSQVI